MGFCKVLQDLQTQMQATVCDEFLENYLEIQQYAAPKVNFVFLSALANIAKQTIRLFRLDLEPLSANSVLYFTPGSGILRSSPDEMGTHDQVLQLLLEKDGRHFQSIITDYTQDINSWRSQFNEKIPTPQHTKSSETQVCHY